MKLLLKKPAPGTLGFGKSCMSFAATGLMHDAAIRFATASTQPAGTNGLDAVIVPVSSLRSPWRMRSVGTVAVCDSARSLRVA